MRIADVASLVLSVAVVTVSCSSTTDGGVCLPYCRDSGAYPLDDASGDATPGDGSTDGGPPSDAASMKDAAAACPQGPAGANGCNALTILGTPITATEVDGGAPSPAGGTVADGLYVLESVTAYGVTSAGTLRTVLSICGSSWQWVIAADAETPYAVNYTYTLASPGGTVFNLLQTCGQDAGSAAGQGQSYTADATHLSLYSLGASSINLVTTLKKQ